MKSAVKKGRLDGGLSKCSGREAGDGRKMVVRVGTSVSVRVRPAGAEPSRVAVRGSSRTQIHVPVHLASSTGAVPWYTLHYTLPLYHYTTIRYHYTINTQFSHHHHDHPHPLHHAPGLSVRTACRRRAPPDRCWHRYWSVVRNLNVCIPYRS